MSDKATRRHLSPSDIESVLFEQWKKYGDLLFDIEVDWGAGPEREGITEPFVNHRYLTFILGKPFIVLGEDVKEPYDGELCGKAASPDDLGLIYGKINLQMNCSVFSKEAARV